ncbi:hypothetical protein ACNKHU_14560 [Shigella flexneri]
MLHLQNVAAIGDRCGAMSMAGCWPITMWARRCRLSAPPPPSVPPLLNISACNGTPISAADGFDRGGKLWQRDLRLVG